MNTKNVLQDTSPDDRLRGWIDRSGLNIPQFAREMGYSYNHALLVVKGERPITEETLGRLLITYGPDGPAWPVAQALVAKREREAQAEKPARRGTGPLGRKAK